MDQVPIDDIGGKEFWVEHFGPGKAVAWDVFVDYLKDYLLINDQSEIPRDVTLEQVLRYTVDRGAESLERNHITVEEWDIFLHRFGPLERAVGKAYRSFFTSGGHLVPWFHGRISRQRAKELMVGGVVGYFLVRFSETNPKNFSLTYLDQVVVDPLEVPPNPPLGTRMSSRPASEPDILQLSVSGAIPSTTTMIKSKHVLIYNLGQGFALSKEAGEGEVFPSIRDLVEYHQAEWSKPCPSSLAHQLSEEIARARARAPVRVMEGGDGFGALEGGLSSLVISTRQPNGTGEIDDSEDDSDDDSNAAYSNPTDEGSNSDSNTSPPMTPVDPANGHLLTPLGPPSTDQQGVEALPPLPPLPPGDYKAWLNNAMLSAASGKYMEALRVLDEILAQVVEDDLEALELRGRAAKIKGTVLQDLGKVEEACEWFELSVRLGKDIMEQSPATTDIGEQFPTLRFVHHQLASNYIASQAFAQVVEHYEHFLAYTEDDAERHIILADFDKLRREFDFWRGVNRTVIDSELEEGIRLFREKRLELALDKFERTIQMARLSPVDRRIEARALGNCATVNRELGRYNQAILNYRLSCRIFRALGDKQMERKMLNGLSLCCVDAGRLADGYEYCQELLAITERGDNVSLIKARADNIASKLGLGKKPKEESPPRPPAIR